MRSLSTHLLSRFAIVMLIAASLIMKLDALHHRPELKEAVADDVGYIWNADLFKTVSFGHETMAVDFLMLKFLTAQEYKHVFPGKRAKQYYELDLATSVDPAFYDLYLSGANFLAVVRNDSKSAHELISKGEDFRRDVLPTYPESFTQRFWKYNWRIPFTKVYIELFELNDLVAATQTLSVVEQIEDVPPYLKNLHQSLRDPVKRYDVALRILNQSILAAELPVEVERLHKRRDGIQMGRYLAELTVVFQGFRNSPSIKKMSDENAFNAFLTRYPEYRVDPRGGRIRLGKTGRLETTSPFETVAGAQ